MGESDKLPEILPPSKSITPVNLWRWRVSPKTARVIRIAAATVPLGGAAYWFQNFLQLRGIVNLTASRIDLGLVTLCVLVAAYLLTEGTRCTWTWRIVFSTIIISAAFGIDWWAPKPQIRIEAKMPGEPKPVPPQTNPQPNFQSPPASPGKPKATLPKQNEAAKSTPEPHQNPVTKSGVELAVSLVGPADPAVVVENQSDDLVEGVKWELVMFRTTDQALFSYPAQDIGYIKPHSRSAAYSMRPNALPHAPGGNQITDGESFIGTLAIDCPLCRGTTLIVSFVWGSSGWFYEVPDGNGRLLLPKGTSKETVSQFIENITAAVKPQNRTPIL